MIEVPKIPRENLILRPYLVIERFIDELDDFIAVWMEAYPKHLTRYDIISRLHELTKELEGLENKDRKEVNLNRRKQAEDKLRDVERELVRNLGLDPGDEDG
jgi:hypothetical protein